MKGVENPAWKIHNTSECNFKMYYKKKMTDSSNSDESDKKRQKHNYKSSYTIKKVAIETCKKGS